MDKVIVHPHFRDIEIPDVDRVPADASFRWLAAGWRDMWRTPLFSLSYGLVFALLGYALVVWAWRHVPVAMLLTSGFLLVAPFLAIGFYDLSRQLENSAIRPSFMHSLKAWRENSATIGFYALLLAFTLSVWERLSAIVISLFMKPDEIVDVQHFAREVLAGGHLPFLLAYGVFGAVLAVVVFALSVVSLPMIMDRKVDLATALVTSFMVVRENPVPMLVWAALIVGLILLGYASFLVGMVIAFPLVGHATWHAYRDLVEQPMR